MYQYRQGVVEKKCCNNKTRILSITFVYSKVEPLPFSMIANKTDPNPAIIVSGNTYNRNSKEFEITVDAMHNINCTN